MKYLYTYHKEYSNFYPRRLLLYSLFKCKTTMGQQWSNEQKEELHRIWTSRKTKFDPENKKYQYQIMSHYMSALMPSVKFKPIGIEWKKMGFQGENPVTDIRAGGLLSL